jgi:hypothetical protein
VEGVLAFQIADLRRMAGKELHFDSWHHSGPCTYLESGMRGYLDHARVGHVSADPELCTWGTLGLILELGAIYE